MASILGDNGYKIGSRKRYVVGFVFIFVIVFLLPRVRIVLNCIISLATSLCCPLFQTHKSGGTNLLYNIASLTPRMGPSFSLDCLD